MASYENVKLTCGVIGTLGLYSVLYKENKVYRMFEHIFLGLAGGWMLVALWTETMKENWWDLMTGRVADKAPFAVEANGYYIWALMLPIGIMGYFVVSKKHAWLSRIPIGLIIGLWSGQQFSAWLKKYGPQLNNSMAPLWPNSGGFFRPLVEVRGTDGLYTPLPPERVAEINGNVYGSQAIVNAVALITLLCVLSYFIFSVNFKGKFMNGVTKLGRYLLMIGFGAIFGSTVMMRFSLLIDRMYFIFMEWLKNGVFGLPI